MRALPALPASCLALLLIAAGFTLPLLSRTAAAYGERVYAANTAIGTGDPHLIVYHDQTVAQSFTAQRTYSLLNLTLRLRNLWNNQNTLTVTIRPNDPVTNVPGSPILASQTVVENGTVWNDSIPFSPSPVLYAGLTYWIVATNSAQQPQNGYEWHYSDSDRYPGGHAEAFNVTTSTWISYLAYDMYFVAYGREVGANVTVALTADRTQAPIQSFVNLTVAFNNTGSQAAPKIWINASLPTAYMYVSDTSGSSSPASSTPFPSYTFSNVSNGPHAFRITASVNIGVAPGTVAVSQVSMAYVNATGALRSGLTAQVSVTVGLEYKQLYLAPGVTPVPATQVLTTTPPTGATGTTTPALASGQSATFALTPILAGPFTVQGATANLWLASQGGKTLVVNATLLDNGTMVGHQTLLLATPGTGVKSVSIALPPMAYTFLRFHQIQLRVLNDVGTQDKILLTYNATSAPSQLDVLTPTYVNVDALTLLAGGRTPSAFTPKDRITVRANVSDPFGISRILGASLRVVTSSGGSVVGPVSMTPVANDTSSVPAWRLYGFSLPSSLSNGTYQAVVTATEDNGVVGMAARGVTVRAPAFEFTKLASTQRTKAGAQFTYDLWFNNTGTGPAGQVWVNDTLPSQVSFLSAAYTVSGTFLGVAPIPGGHSWTWSSVAPGSANVLRIGVSVAANMTQVAWIHNAATLFFTDENGHPWASVASSADVIVNGPLLDFAVGPNLASGIHANQSVVYAVRLTNLGDAAQYLWVNATLPTGLSYEGNTSGAIGGRTTVVGRDVNTFLANMPAGANWNFTLTFRTPTAISGGSTLRTSFGLNYTSANSILMPARTLGSTLLVLAPAIPSIALSLGSTKVTPGQVLHGSVRFSNAGNEAAPTLWLNLTGDAAFQFLNASSRPAVRYTSVSVSLAFTFAGLAVGPTTVFLNLTLLAQTPDGITVSMSGSADYVDAYGNHLPRVSVPSVSVTTTRPVLLLSVAPGVTTVESGTPLNYTLSALNSGTGTAVNAWLNTTLPAGLDYVGDTSAATRTVLGTSYSWHWNNQAPGPRAFVLSLRAKAATLDGSTANLSFTLAYTDSAGFLQSTAASTRVTFLAPSLVLSLTSKSGNVFPGSRIDFVLQVRNEGNTTAHWVSVSDSLDQRLAAVSFNSSVPAIGTSELTWNFTDLAPGQTQVVTLTAQVDDGVAARTPLSTSFEALYSNSRGGPSIGFVQSPTVTLEVGVDLVPLLYIGLAGVVAMPLLAFVASRRFRVQIEEVFLVYRDGVLISHLSRTLLQDKDEDVLTGMLTAVQEFVRDAFQYGEHRELHQMDFGEYRIMIERGRLAYLAVVYSGKNASSIRRKVREVLDKIEDEYGEVLERWDGDMEKVVGARDMIRDYLLGARTNGKNHGRIEAE